jgi:hypothetical protein
VQQPGAAVLRRQGLGGAAAHRREGLPPGKFPFPLVHIDTGHNFPEVIEFRDRRAAELGERLVVRSVEDSIKRGTVRLRNPQTDSRNAAQAVTLLETIEEFKFDACIGGAAATKKRPAPRNASSPSATNSANGTQGPAPRAVGPV